MKLMIQLIWLDSMMEQLVRMFICFKCILNLHQVDRSQSQNPRLTRFHHQIMKMTDLAEARVPVAVKHLHLLLNQEANQIQFLLLMTTMIIHLHQGQVVVKIHLLQTMKMMTTLPVQRREIIHHLIKKAVAVKANHHQIMRQEE